LPINAYNAEMPTDNKDEYLLTLIEELEELRTEPDLRPVLDERYNVKQTLKNAKLI
jgi:hypothetical protein